MRLGVCADIEFLRELAFHFPWSRQPNINEENGKILREFPLQADLLLHGITKLGGYIFAVLVFLKPLNTLFLLSNIYKYSNTFS